jgi:hypothetical protein
VVIGGRARSRRKPALSSSTHNVARHSPIYDIDGPKVRLGALWGLLLGACLVLGITALTVVYAVIAAVAGSQAARAWRMHSRAEPSPALAAIGAGSMVVATRLGVASLGLACLGVVVSALAVAAAQPTQRRRRTTSDVLADTGVTLQCTLFTGLAASSPILAARVQLGAALVLVVLVCAYEVGDFLVGSGSANMVEGPVAGMVSVAVITFSLTVFDQLIGIPPFEGFSLVFFGVAVGVLAPFGPITASILLPRADARAPALRRIDTLLVAGPVWTLALWAYVGI